MSTNIDLPKGPVKLTPRQIKANDLLGSDASHVILYGGSRSGKTFLLMRAVLMRAFAHKSRHAIFRFRFNHIKTSVVSDTLPKVMELCFPGAAQHCKLDKTDWVYKLPNESEIWFAGLDDKERTEKILGQEYATLYFNECSQITWAARNVAMTRLAQKTPLRNKAYYDCNPPGQAHWTYRLFVEKRDPDSRQLMKEPMNYGAMLLNPKDNEENLGPNYIKELEAMPARMRQRFLLGQFAGADESALWTLECLEASRVTDLPDMLRIVVAVDPSGCSGDEDSRSDEVGIVVVGLGKDGHGYVLEDLSGKHGPSGPRGWGAIAVSAYERWDADCIVAETNFGGAMVEAVIRAAKPGIPYREVKASRGKIARAEPISALFEQGKVHMAGMFSDLEDQLVSMTTGGYIGSNSPDRADAMVWGLTHIFPGMTKQNDNGRTAMPVVNLGHANLKKRY